MNICGVVTAAGLSSRMGDFKPLMSINGITMIERTIDSMLKAGIEQVVVVLGYRGEEVKKLITEKYSAKRVITAFNEEYFTTDMLCSIKIGISTLKKCDAFYILPGDMPAINMRTFQTMKEALDNPGILVVVPTLHDRRKHPPLVRWSCIPDIMDYNGAEGLRGVWNQLGDKLLEVPIQDMGCGMDADTKQDFSRIERYLVPFTAEQAYL
ncbi:nucleotidyltransferase family protein [Anaerocolumna sp.]|uniref:nucleotidyltransferase family protein n=1 Tax=Anaerocolumna sp. TaxID=2041569 RepID=UPI0028A81334|nr:nucleotidyltransferase family protein [Anaerocolumna sp.]